MKGYKVFNPDWKCRNFQYEVGKTYEMNETPKICAVGFHFCKEASDCFNYYDFNALNKIAEVEALGDISYSNDDTKACTNKIKIVREIPWSELLNIINEGIGNTGLKNTGDYNTGSQNIGSHNTGSNNVGWDNAGSYNTGDYNTGSDNEGIRNTGNKNIGHFNSGDCNKGHHNAGNFNVGYGNTGDCNFSDYNTGCFNTEKHTIMFFDKPSEMTYEEWLTSKAHQILVYEVFDWENKNKYIQERWDRLSSKDKDVIKKIPNFDKEKFEKITGIKI